MFFVRMLGYWIFPLSWISNFMSVVYLIT